MRYIFVSDFQRGLIKRQNSPSFSSMAVYSSSSRPIGMTSKWNFQRLQKILGKRQRLLAYLLKKNRGHYKELIGELDIREIKTPEA